MIRHAGDFCQGPEGEQKGPYPKPSVSGWAAREDKKEVGTSSHASDAGPRLVVVCGSVRWHRGVVVVLAVPGGASLVEEVGLEGGGQWQRVDLAQAPLPQGQAHRATAEIHER